MSADIYALLARRVREERGRAGLTLEQLAAAAELSLGFLAYVERNQKKPSLASVKRIADALELPVSDLFADVPAARRPRGAAAGRLMYVFERAPAARRRLILKVAEDIVAS